MDKQDGYLGDLIDTAIDVVQYQVDKWRNDNDGDITRDDIDNLLDQYHDEVTTTELHLTAYTQATLRTFTTPTPTLTSC